MLTDLFTFFLYCYFTAGILGSLFARMAQNVYGPSSLFSHGKSAIIGDYKKRTCNSLIEWITTLTVSKYLFWHFYALGLIFSLIYINLSKNNQISAILLAFQCFRRLLECFFVMPGAKGSQMHLIHYAIGISYYPVLLLAFQLNKTQNEYLWKWILLFVISSVLQSYCHRILGSVRLQIKPDRSHQPINHPLFKFVHTPHYLAELFIYLSIAGLQGFQPLILLNLIWIISILGVSAKNSADWLCKGSGYKSHESFCKYLMIPYLF